MSFIPRATLLGVISAALIATPLAASASVAPGATGAPSESKTAAASPSAQQRAISSPVVTSIGVSGTATRVATVTLGGGHAGETVFGYVDKSGETSDQTHFDAAGRATVEIPVAAGALTVVEFHVFAAAGQTGQPFVLEAVANDTADTSFAPTLESISYAGSPTTAHITLRGLVPGSEVRSYNSATTIRPPAVRAGADGWATIDMSLKSGVQNFVVFTLASPTGSLALGLHVDGDQSPTPVPERPTVTVTDGSSADTVTVAVDDRSGADVQLTGRSGPLAGSRLDSNGHAELVLPRPLTETPITVVTTWNGSPRTAKVILAEGQGGDRPAPPVLRESGSTATAVVIEVRGEAATTATVTDGDGNKKAIRPIGPSGRAQVVVARPSTASTYSVRLGRGDVVSQATTIALAP